MIIGASNAQQETDGCLTGAGPSSSHCTGSSSRSGNLDVQPNAAAADKAAAEVQLFAKPQRCAKGFQPSLN